MGSGRNLAAAENAENPVDSKEDQSAGLANGKDTKIVSDHHQAKTDTLVWTFSPRQ